MTMLSLLTPWMLAGTLLVAVPIVLHLVMKQKPKHLIFPALRFLKQREVAQKRNLRWRHLLLLALRCAAIVFLALALTRPTFRASGIGADQEAPVAAAVVIDTAPRMEYRHHNQTRIESSKETLDWLLSQLPSESDVAILDSSNMNAAFAVDMSAGKQRVSRLATTPAAMPLGQTISKALELLRTSTRERKELYICTDLSSAAWTPESNIRLKKQLEAAPDIGIYVVDVGISDARDNALGQLKLSSESMVPNTSLQLETELHNFGPASPASIAVYQLDQSGNPQLRGQRDITADQPTASTQFSLAGMTDGLQQGTVKLLGSDGLEANNIRYFTTMVRPPWQVLIATQKPVEAHSVFLSSALQSGRQINTEVIALDDLAHKQLTDYGAICLLDPGPLSDAQWQQLASYVRGGGGVAIWLGRHAVPVESFNTPAAAAVMPGKLVRQWRGGDSGLFLAPRDLSHPALAKFRTLGGSVPWEAFPIWRMWQVSDLEKGVSVIVPFNNGQPAVLEKIIGRGHVIVTTTPVSEAASDRDPWNTLAIDSWPFMLLSEQMTMHLVGSGDQRFNYTSGDTVVLHIPEAQRDKPFVLVTPSGDTIPQTVNAKEGTITITGATQPGNYRLRTGGEPDRGFSVNLSDEATRLDRIAPAELSSTLGEGRFRLAHNQDEINRDLNLGRVGRELYPLLILLVAILLGLEYIVAGRFYRRPTNEPKDQRRAAEIAAAMAASPPPELPKRRWANADAPPPESTEPPDQSSNPVETSA